MAINYDEFIYTNTDKKAKGLMIGLKANKEFNKFLYRCKINNKQVRKIFDYSNKNWNKKDTISNINSEAKNFKEKRIEELENPFNQNTTLDFIANEYFSKKCVDSKWTNARKRQYELYIKPFIGTKKISTVKENDIDTIRKSMETKGHSKQNENGCSIRTIEKILLQILKPILEYAQSNGALTKPIPSITIPNRNKKRKKIVTNATEKISLLFNTILNRYRDDPFYRALFLFALYGRRWNEIATLQWSDINLNSNRYTIRADNNKIGQDQTYDLPYHIKEPLIELQDAHGLVFKSPKTGEKLHPPRKQLAKIKEDTQIEELTMHYFRHILVTALGETGTAATVLSASLGHTRAETVDEVYRTINHLKGSQSANKQLESIIDIEVIG